MRFNLRLPDLDLLDIREHYRMRLKARAAHSVSGNNLDEVNRQMETMDCLYCQR